MACSTLSGTFTTSSLRKADMVIAFSDASVQFSAVVLLG